MPTKHFSEFSESFKILNRSIGPGSPVYIIAEAGVAHFGDISLARDLVDLAVNGGADAFKIQIFDVERLISAHESSWRERLRHRNLSFDEVCELKSRCDDAGIAFIATAHDESRIPWLKSLDVPAIKIGSGERNNPIFLRNLAKLNLPIILSTGMYSKSDVEEALQTLSAVATKEVALLHCITSYPAPDSDINLSAMDNLKNMFSGPVGYSDHTTDNLAVLAAVARGAVIIEKHITIRRDVPNAHDWKVSAGPEEFLKLVQEVRRLESFVGHGRIEAAPSEASAISWATKSVVVNRSLPAGHRLELSDLDAKRPGTGTAANMLENFVGRILRHAVDTDTQISLEDLE